IRYPLFLPVLEGAAAVDGALSLLTGIAVKHLNLTVGAPIMRHHGRILKTPHNLMGITGVLKVQRIRIEVGPIRVGVGEDIVDEATTTRALDKATETTALIPEEVLQGPSIKPPLGLYLFCTTPRCRPLNLKVLMYLVLFDIIYHVD
ncbi:hypothetical protein FRC11_011723, partial [Ceratobasidium sp. 423]